MAEFSIREVEGMRQIRIDIREETVRARRGALSNMRGQITMTPRLPGLRDVWASMFTREARIRPYYHGTGSIYLRPTLGGYHLLTVAPGERWILEPGAFWASEGATRLGFTREPMWSSLWAGDGLLSWKTTVGGEGVVAINAPGPVEVVEVEEGRLEAQGRLMLGRTDGLRFSTRRAARWPRHWLAGQERLRAFSGSGKALVCWTSYWNERLYRRFNDEMQKGIFYRGT